MVGTYMKNPPSPIGCQDDMCVPSQPAELIEDLTIGTLFDHVLIVVAESKTEFPVYKIRDPFSDFQKTLN
jgi:hypothetical protein